MNRNGGPEASSIEARVRDGFHNIDDVLSFEERKAIVRGYAPPRDMPRVRSISLRCEPAMLWRIR